MRNSGWLVRQATPRDVPALVELNHLAYPDLREENVVWTAAQVESHLASFAHGQLVVARDERILGAASSLIVDLGRRPLRRHTWAGITDDGYFSNHDPDGDTLYGADVYVHPGARGAGIGAALYAARRALCRALGLRRILTGGRLSSYHAHTDLSPQQYVDQVVAGALYDDALTFQLRAGFVVRGVLADYLRDPASLNYASLLEWLNPDYVTPSRCRHCGDAVGARVAPFSPTRHPDVEGFSLLCESSP